MDLGWTLDAILGMSKVIWRGESMRTNATVATLLVTLVLCAAAVSPAGTKAAAPGDAPSDAVTADAAEYARIVGVPQAEARRRLELQPSIGDLNQALQEHEGASFAGLVIEHVPEYRIVARFTKDGDATIRRYTAGSGLASLVELEDAAYSLGQLEKERQALMAELPIGQAIAEIDVRANRVLVEVLIGTDAERAISERFLVLPDSAVSMVVPAMPTPAVDLYGGLSLTTCTSGFTIVKGGSRALATAGHCPNAQSYLGNALVYQNDEVKAGNRDAQSHKLGGAIYKNLVFDGQLPNPLTRPITGKVFWVNQNIGDFVCKYGKVTHFGCGFIVSDTNPGCMNPLGSLYIKVDSDPNGAGFDLAEGGDSGGPWFVGNKAYGITSCQQGFDAIYETVGFIEGALGATILTVP